MQMVRVCPCGNTTELSPPASITTFPLQAHALSLIMHRETVKTSCAVVKTGGLKSVPTRDKATYAGKWWNSDFHWRKQKSTIYKKAIVLEWHECSLCHDIRGRECPGGCSVCNEQSTHQRTWQSHLTVVKWAVGVFFYCLKKLDSWQYSCMLLPGQIYGEERAQAEHAGYCCDLWLITAKNWPHGDNVFQLLC